MATAIMATLAIELVIYSKGGMQKCLLFAHQKSLPGKGE